MGERISTESMFAKILIFLKFKIFLNLALCFSFIMIIWIRQLQRTLQDVCLNLAGLQLAGVLEQNKRV